jgi:hypothetical protein
MAADPITLATIAKIGIPALGIGALFGGGGDGLGKEQKKLVDSQTAIAKLMEEIMRSRHQLTGPTQGPSGQLQGPMVEAVMAALGNQRQQAATPRMRLQSPSFNPFGESTTQTFGASSPTRKATPESS